MLENILLSDFLFWFTLIKAITAIRMGCNAIPGDLEWNQNPSAHLLSAPNPTDPNLKSVRLFKCRYTCKLSDFQRIYTIATPFVSKINSLVLIKLEGLYALTWKLRIGLSLVSFHCFEGKFIAKKHGWTHWESSHCIDRGAPKKDLLGMEKG